jgi:hypothetical protein
MKKMKSEQAVLPNPCLKEEEEEDVFREETARQKILNLGGSTDSPNLICSYYLFRQYRCAISMMFRYSALS